MKNFFIKQMRKHNTITKIKNHIDYLLNENTASHYKSKIHSLTENVKETYERIYFENEKYISYQKENGGGRPPEASTTYVLSIPEDLIHPTNEQWNDIYNKTIENFCNFINENQQKKENKGLDHIKEKNRANIAKYNAIRLDPEMFKSNSVAVVHNEEDNFEEASHLHIITSNIQNGNYLKMLNQTAGQNYIKKAYDKAIFDTLKLKPQDYIPKCDRLSEEEKNQLEIEDKRQFEARMKDNPKYTSSEKKKGGRRRRKPPKPQHIARQEEWKRKTNQAQKKIDQVPEAQERINRANELQSQRKSEQEALRAAEAAKSNVLSEVSAAKKEHSKVVAKTQKVIAKRKANSKEIQSSKKRLNEINKQIQQNESWFVNFVKSEPIQEYLNGVRQYFEKGFNFKLYQEVTDFLRNLNKSNEKMINKIKEHNPDWLREQEEKAKRIAEEKRIKYENRFKGGVFEEDIELDDIKEEVNKKIEQENKEKEKEKEKETLTQRVKKKIGFKI
ncbi:hypothetical protein [Vibrio harveyi]|uniref:hypothetical protein n=1 Tax=Vibrio harveyi TaxID=669 RepID=UPI0002D35A1C|nr:hypothetical protein [Vibrio harveyi]